jgi:hypothetical protein
LVVGVVVVVCGIVFWWLRELSGWWVRAGRMIRVKVEGSVVAAAMVCV